MLTQLDIQPQQSLKDTSSSHLHQLKDQARSEPDHATFSYLPQDPPLNLMSQSDQMSKSEDQSTQLLGRELSSESSQNFTQESTENPDHPEEATTSEPISDTDRTSDITRYHPQELLEAEELREAQMEREVDSSQEFSQEDQAALSK